MYIMMCLPSMSSARKGMVSGSKVMYSSPSLLAMLSMAARLANLTFTPRSKVKVIGHDTCSNNLTVTNILVAFCNRFAKQFDMY